MSGLIDTFTVGTEKWEHMV